MKYLSIFVLAYTLAAQTVAASPATMQSPDTLNRPLAAFLDTIWHDDQYYREKALAMQDDTATSEQEMNAMWKLVAEKDSINTKSVTQLLEKQGWPPVEEIGAKGSQAIFLVIQHADLATQVKYLPRVRKAAEDKNLDKGALAMLEDRVLLRQGQKQIYGTQLLTVDNGFTYVRPMIDPEHVDERRRQMDMEPMSEYLKNYHITWSVPAYEKALKEADKLLSMESK